MNFSPFQGVPWRKGHRRKASAAVIACTHGRKKMAAVKVLAFSVVATIWRWRREKAVQGFRAPGGRWRRGGVVLLLKISAVQGFRAGQGWGSSYTLKEYTIGKLQKLLPKSKGPDCYPCKYLHLPFFIKKYRTVRTVMKYFLSNELNLNLHIFTLEKFEY